LLHINLTNLFRGPGCGVDFRAMERTCSKCGVEFDLSPGKPGYANVCPDCTESREQSDRKTADAEMLHRKWAAASRENSRKIEQTGRRDRMLESLGFAEVPGTRLTVRKNQC
jgi:hypothetical protein